MGFALHVAGEGDGCAVFAEGAGEGEQEGGGEAGRGEGQEHFEGDFCGFSAFDEGDFFVFTGNSLQGGDRGGNEEG